MVYKDANMCPLAHPTRSFRLSLWAPVVACAGALFYLSSQSTLPVSVVSSDLVAHAVVYTVLGLLSHRAFHGGVRPIRWRPALAALALTIVYGATDELHQAFVPGRDTSLLDLAADTAGALVATAIFAAVGRPVGRSRSTPAA